MTVVSTETSKMTRNRVEHILFSDIIVNQESNTRKVDPNSDDIKSLADSIKSRGLLENLVVREIQDIKNGTNKARTVYELVSGFRRHAALTLIGVDGTVPCTIVFGTESDIKIVNLVENVQRKQVKTAEIAIRCHDMSKKLGMKDEFIAKELGYSKQYVHQLIWIIEKTHPRIIDAWRKNESEIKIEMMLKYAGLDKPAQIERFNTFMDEKKSIVDKEEDNEPKKEKKDKPIRMARRIEVEEAIHIISHKDAKTKGFILNPDTKKAVKTVLRWVADRSKECPIFIPIQEINDLDDDD